MSNLSTTDVSTITKNVSLNFKLESMKTLQDARELLIPYVRFRCVHGVLCVAPLFFTSALNFHSTSSGLIRMQYKNAVTRCKT